MKFKEQREVLGSCGFKLKICVVFKMDVFLVHRVKNMVKVSLEITVKFFFGVIDGLVYVHHTPLGCCPSQGLT